MSMALWRYMTSLRRIMRDKWPPYESPKSWYWLTTVSLLTISSKLSLKAATWYLKRCTLLRTAPIITWSTTEAWQRWLISEAAETAKSKKIRILGKKIICRYFPMAAALSRKWLGRSKRTTWYTASVRSISQTHLTIRIRLMTCKTYKIKWVFRNLQLWAIILWWINSRAK